MSMTGLYLTGEKGVNAKGIKAAKPYFLTPCSHSTAFLSITPYVVKTFSAQPRRRNFSNARKHILL
jgi:hypothetical protein